MEAAPFCQPARHSPFAIRRTLLEISIRVTSNLVAVRGVHGQHVNQRTFLALSTLPVSQLWPVESSIVHLACLHGKLGVVIAVGIVAKCCSCNLCLWP